MIEGIIILVSIAVIGLAYFACAIFKHGTCDIGRVFTLLVVVVGLVTGAFLYIHAYTFLKASFLEDAVWTAVAGIVLFISSGQQIVVMFRKQFVRRIDPLKRNNETNPTNLGSG
jgi:hypothetical protein